MNADQGARNLAWADALVAALAAAGIRHFVLAPGARSAPLTVAAFRRRELVCHVINDERAAGFFALGIGKATGVPAAVVTTSGTAAANLLPAIVEANLSTTPLLAITADRPAELVGWGANQTIDQLALFSAQLRACHRLPPPAETFAERYFLVLARRLLREACGPPAGPVHVNLPFREPLLPEKISAPPTFPLAVTDIAGKTTLAPQSVSRLARRLAASPGVILCGEGPFPADFGPALVELANRLDAPLLAETLSGLRYGETSNAVLAHASRFLRRSPLPSPGWVLRFGRFPLSRSNERWLASLTMSEHILVALPGQWPDPLWQIGARIEADPLPLIVALREAIEPVAARGFAVSWQEAEKGASAEAARLCAERFFEGSICRALLARLPPAANLFVGNSLAIRALDAFGGVRRAPLSVFANRGASGIDGNLATAAGIAAASGRPTVAVVGDQTLLHDATSLALCKREDVTVILLNNGGGGIFRHLSFAEHLPEEVLEAAFVATPAVDFAALAAAFALHHRRADDHATFALALSAADTAALIEAVIDPRTSRLAFAA